MRCEKEILYNLRNHISYDFLFGNLFAYSYIPGKERT